MWSDKEDITVQIEIEKLVKNALMLNNGCTVEIQSIIKEDGVPELDTNDETTGPAKYTDSTERCIITETYSNL